MKAIKRRNDRMLTGSLSGKDADGDAITAQVASGPSHGTLTFNPDGTFTYTPNTHYVRTDSFTYT
jgi:VCBS repeat-containing protein